MKFEGSLVLNVIIALVIYKVIDKLFLDKAFSSLGFFEESLED